MLTGGLRIFYAKREMPRTDRVGFRLQQQMQRLPAAQVEPKHDEVKGVRRRNFLQPQQLAIEMPAARDVGDDDGTVVEVGDVHEAILSCNCEQGDTFRAAHGAQRSKRPASDGRLLRCAPCAALTAFWCAKRKQCLFTTLNYR